MMNKDMSEQEGVKLLEEILVKNPLVQEILHLAPKLKMPNWYLGAGCVTQSVWNYYHGFDLATGVKDCDLVYFDASDISYEAEDAYIQKSKELFSHLPFPVDLKNQARVHVWYEKRFGQKIQPYQSAEEAIATWPTTATSIGVRYDERGHFLVYSAFGLHNLFDLIIRPNKVKITEDIYLAKVDRWTKIWNKLKVIPWNG